MMKSIILTLLFYACAGSCGKHYVVSKEKATWHDAFNHCKANGTQLVSVANRTDYHHLQTFIAEKLNCTEKFAVWIGANDLATKGTFTWVATSRRVKFTNWKPKKKLDNVSKAREEHCIEVMFYLKRSYQWHWRKSECRRKGFTCVKRCTLEFIN